SVYLLCVIVLTRLKIDIFGFQTCLVVEVRCSARFAAHLPMYQPRKELSTVRANFFYKRLKSLQNKDLSLSFWDKLEKYRKILL
ncbi:MAG: hypothetical protein KME17_26900, partial [Cyanosarcina radialis HA8281-LM2]|nr:hypothetical protein [Cyanosarcina radialis HA8281-LM2]